MRNPIARLRGFKLLAPIYASHYFLNVIGACCKLADKLFRSNLHEPLQERPHGRRRRTHPPQEAPQPAPCLAAVDLSLNPRTLQN